MNPIPGQPFVDSTKVPYSGAAADVDLNGKHLTNVSYLALAAAIELDSDGSASFAGGVLEIGADGSLATVAPASVGGLLSTGEWYFDVSTLSGYNRFFVGQYQNTVSGWTANGFAFTNQNSGSSDVYGFACNGDSVFIGDTTGGSVDFCFYLQSAASGANPVSFGSDGSASFAGGNVFIDSTGAVTLAGLGNYANNAAAIAAGLAAGQLYRNGDNLCIVH